MTSESLSLHHDGSVATLVIDLPRPKNAFRRGDVERFAALLAEVAASDARCLVVRGAADVFSAGWDVTSIDPARDDPAALLAETVGPFCRQLRELPLPTIAAVAGPALGFGFGLAMACDLCLVEDTAMLGSPFRHIGMVPDSGTHHALLTRLGHARAFELICSGRLLGGAEAVAIGLANKRVDAGCAAAEAEALAASIAAGPTAAFRHSKHILLQGGSFEAMLDAEAEALSQVFATADLQEGVRAFGERRKPRFVGR